MDPTTAKQAADQTFQYGAIGVIAFVFAVAIVVLWRTYLKREEKREGERDEMIKERKAWEIAELTIRKECETEKRVLVEKYAVDLKLLQTESQKREDEIRRGFAEIMDNVSAEAGKSSQALVDMLQKFYERFVGPTRRY